MSNKFSEVSPSPLKIDVSIYEGTTTNAQDQSMREDSQEEEMVFDDQPDQESHIIQYQADLNYKRFKSHKEDTINDIDVQVQSPLAMTMGRQTAVKGVSAFNLNPLSMLNNIEASIEEENQISHLNG